MRQEYIIPFFALPPPALPGSGSVGMISVRYFRTPHCVKSGQRYDKNTSLSLLGLAKGNEKLKIFHTFPYFQFNQLQIYVFCVIALRSLSTVWNSRKDIASGGRYGFNACFIFNAL